MVNSIVGAEHVKVLSLNSVESQVGAFHVKTLASNQVDSQIGAMHVKVLAQYPQEYIDMGNALNSMRRLRYRDSKTQSN